MTTTSSNHLSRHRHERLVSASLVTAKKWCESNDGWRPIQTRSMIFCFSLLLFLYLYFALEESDAKCCCCCCYMLLLLLLHTRVPSFHFKKKRNARIKESIVDRPFPPSHALTGFDVRQRHFLGSTNEPTTLSIAEPVIFHARLQSRQLTQFSISRNSNIQMASRVLRC